VLILDTLVSPSYNGVRLKHQSKVILITILIVAAFLRINSLDQVPPSLFGDEVDVGYQAYSLLGTGQDLNGQSWPTLVHSLSEYRAPLFIYSAVPFVSLFGLNEWGVRLPAAFYGILGIFGIYLLSRELFNEKIGLLASGFLAISPWHLQYSRAGFEVTMLLALLIFGTYFFLKGLEKKWLLIISAVVFGLTPYTYSTAIVFMPFLIVILLVLFRKQIKGLGVFGMLGLLGFFIILSPYIVQTLSGKSGERFNIISIFGNQSIQDKVILAKQSEDLEISQKIFHNVDLTYLHFFFINYLRAYSPEFLFIYGDPNQRHSVGDMGEMYFFEMLLLGFGLYGIFGGLRKKEFQLVLAWLLLAPIPAALTYDGGFHGTRNFLMIVPLMVILSLGLSDLTSELAISKSKLSRLNWIPACAGMTLIVIGVFNVTFYLHRYHVDYPKISWSAWHYGFKEVFQKEKSLDSQFTRVLINNTYEPALIRFLFWHQYDPGLFHHQFVTDKASADILPGFDGFNLGKYYFGKFNGPFEERLDSNTLWIASARDDITNPETLTDTRVKLLETIYSPTDEPIFYLITGSMEMKNEQ